MANTPSVIPNMPDEIKRAIDTNSLYIFVGAGVSRLYGYPSWDQMGKNLINIAVTKKALSRSEEAVLLNGNFTPMQFVTIAFNKLQKKLGKEEAEKLVISELSLDKQKDPANLRKVNTISKLLSKYNSVILTTNADLSLDTSKPYKDKAIVSDFKLWDRNEDYVKIFHLHGSINNFESMVFTSQQYASAYMADADFGKNLLQLFGRGDKTVLFIGYGVNEFELIRYFLKTTTTPERPSMFMLNGYLKKDTLKYEFDKEYYRTLGIEVLYYSLEKRAIKH